MESANQEQLSPLQRAAYALKEMRAKLDALERRETEPVAIIGMSCRFPGADSCAAFWRLLRDGIDAVTETPAERWPLDSYYDPNPNAPGKINTRYGGFLADVDQFDALFFGLSPKEATRLDPQHRLLLEVAWEALENAGQSPEALVGTQTGFYLGINQNDYAHWQLSGDPRHFDIYSSTSNGFCFAAGRLSYVLGLQGPCMPVDTACSSSLVALHLACQALRSQECAMALVGGVQLNLAPELTLVLTKTQSLSPSGRCRTFDADADGYILGEGCGVVVLKRLTDALAHRDTILALIRASAVNHDGPSSGITVPNELAQERLLRQVLAKARVAPAEVRYIETHGTGTSLGDPIEVGALGAVFGDRPQSDPLVLGAVKTNIGHLNAASGVAGLIKTVLALQHEEIPPNLHFKTPSPHIDWERWPVKVPTERLLWLRGERRRLAGLSGFGISGTNVHILLEEAPEAAEPENRRVSPERPLHLLTLSAKSEQALQELVQTYASYLAAPEAALADICFTANTGRSHFNHRLAVAADSCAALAEPLRAWRQGTATLELWQGECGRSPLKVAFLFSGIPSAGQGRQLYATQPTFRQAWERCAALLPASLQQPLPALFTDPDAGNGELALFALEYALAELWQAWGIKPAAVLGQGVGEYVAAWVAGMISLEDALELAVERQRLLSSSEGKALPEVLQDAFEQKAGRIACQAPCLPLISMSEGQGFGGGALPDAAYWRRQLGATGRSAQGIAALKDKGCQCFLEIGPEPVFALQDAGQAGAVTWLSSLAAATDDWQALLSSLASLYVRGAAVDWEGFDQDYDRRRQPLPTYPFQRKRYWIGREALQASATQAVSQPGPQPPAAVQVYAESPKVLPPIVAAAGGTSGSPRPTPVVARIMTRQLETASQAVSQVVARQLEFLRRGGAGRTAALFNRPVAASACREPPPQAPIAAGSSAALLPKGATSLGNWHLLALSAETETALESETQQLLQELKEHPDLDLAALAEKRRMRKAFDYRRMLVCRDPGDAIQALESRDPKRVFTQPGEQTGRTVTFMFPGVGDHYVQMGRGLYRASPVFREHIDLCSERLLPSLGEDLRQVLYPPAEEAQESQAASSAEARFDLRKMLSSRQEKPDEATRKLNQTLLSQPAVFVIEYALARLWISWGVKPQALIGYSLGEYVAACLADVLSLEDALRLLVKRAQLIQALPEGVMLAVPLPEAEIVPLLGSELSLATVSTPSQCVVAGPRQAVAGLEQRLKEKGVLYRYLQATHAFHSKMMEPLRGSLTQFARTLVAKPPCIPYLSNITGDWISTAQATDPDYWAQHTCQAVRFAEGIEVLLQTPGSILVEVGPGQSLGSFVLQHPAIQQAPDTVVLASLRTRYDQQSDECFLLNTLGRLWLNGAVAGTMQTHVN
jgi:acyl transferase domain-containing protein